MLGPIFYSFKLAKDTVYRMQNTIDKAKNLYIM